MHQGCHVHLMFSYLGGEKNPENKPFVLAAKEENEKSVKTSRLGQKGTGFIEEL